MPTPLEPVPQLQSSSPRSEYLALLQTLQNTDGGWGFHPNEASRVEPSCWGIAALFARQTSESKSSFNSGPARNAANFLRTAQLPDGSWPASSQMTKGSWITSLACLVLSHDPQSADNVRAGLKWLCEDFPRDSSPLQRFIQRLRPKSHFVSHNDSYRGWGWTPRTSSWVEPTSFALLALREADPQTLPKNADERRALAIPLLYDRMCPGGGWNCGNPRVYGVDGDALVLPTCWALLALSPKPHKNDSQEKMPEKPGRALSLAWLQREFANIQSAGSLAVARMTLENYGIEPPPAKHELQDWSAEDLCEQGAHILAWVCMALDPARNWPAPIRDLAPLSDSAILASRIADTNKFAAPSSFETQSPASQKTVPLKLTEGPAQ